jgi:hypothetical protein
VGLFALARRNSLTVWTFEELMSESHLYTIVLSRNQSTLRFGWISASTGLTYCGICLRAPIRSEIGAECPVCDARVFTHIGSSCRWKLDENRHGERLLPAATVEFELKRTETVGAVRNI